jgi:hypothetical protein
LFSDAEMYRRKAGLAAVIGAVLVAAACTSSSVSQKDVAISDVRAEILAHVGDVTNSAGYRYGVTDDRRHTMDTAKIIQLAETGQFAAVYHWWKVAVVARHEQMSPLRL